MIGCFLLCRLLGAALSLSDHPFSQHRPDDKYLLVIRPFLTDQFVVQGLLAVSLYPLLQDGLTIEKELFMLQIIQYKPPDKFFRASKTTIQIDSADQCFKRIGSDGRALPPSAGKLSPAQQEIGRAHV